MIDTGATRSFIDPEIAQKYFSNKIKPIPFVVSTLFKKHDANGVVTIKAFDELNVDTDLNFSLFKFHNYFDGLIGIDNLFVLKASLDFNNHTLNTPNANVKIKLHKINKKFKNDTKLEIEINPNSYKIAEIPVDQNGENIISEIETEDILIPKTPQFRKIIFEKPIQTELFNQQTFSLLHAQVDYKTDIINNDPFDDDESKKMKILEKVNNSKEIPPAYTPETKANINYKPRVKLKYHKQLRRPPKFQVDATVDNNDNQKPGCSNNRPPAYPFFPLRDQNTNNKIVTNNVPTIMTKPYHTNLYNYKNTL